MKKDTHYDIIGDYNLKDSESYKIMIRLIRLELANMGEKVLTSDLNDQINNLIVKKAEYDGVSNLLNKLLREVDRVAALKAKGN